MVMRRTLTSDIRMAVKNCGSFGIVDAMNNAKKTSRGVCRLDVPFLFS